jgi:hypothetical protein
MDVTPPKLIRDGDKEWARLQYEKFNMSTGDIAKIVNRTQTQVVAWASSGGWVRNKSDAQDKERIAILSANHAQRTLDKLIVERVNVEMQAKVLVSHRKDISGMRKVAAKLWKDLETEADASLDERITMFKKLSDASKTVILLERQAHGIEGALIEPDQATDNGALTPAESAMTSLLGKFASVISKAKETPLATEVIDVPSRG